MSKGETSHDSLEMPHSKGRKVTLERHLNKACESICELTLGDFPTGRDDGFLRKVAADFEVEVKWKQRTEMLRRTRRGPGENPPERMKKASRVPVQTLLRTRSI